MFQGETTNTVLESLAVMYLVTDEFGIKWLQVTSLEKARELTPPNGRIYRVNGPHACEQVK